MEHLSRALTLLVLALGQVQPAACQDNSPAVLLVSFDGFRYDYIDQHDLKNFKKFRAAGAAAQGLVPCFPSSTFPNHYTLVTGLRPASHGLVDNSFYDSAFNVSYSQGNRAAVEDPRFYGGTALWTLAKATGLKTASYFWVGSEHTEEGKRPDRYFIYDEKVPFGSRVDSVLAWLRKEGSVRPRFVTLYFSEPDHTAHETGPRSEETGAVLLKMDSLLGALMTGLKALKSPVNTILVSDHGMTEVTVADSTFVFLDEIYDVRTRRFRTVVSSTLAHLYIDRSSTRDSMITILKARQTQYKVYRKEDLPIQWHYNHYRTGDLVLVANPGHVIRHSNRATYYQRVKPGARVGVHGYDPTTVTEMRGIFLASGPQINEGLQLGLVNNVDIYPLLARILKLKSPPIDGDERALWNVYKGN
jgi:predicted AlkP superfamily pyrophosphatase or phosphodiesterase